MSMIRPSAIRMNPVRASATRLVALSVALLAGCVTPPVATPPAAPPAADPVSPNTAKPVGLPNPATVACIRAGGVASTERGTDGGERGLCRLPTGQVCDQWAFFRSECGSTPVDRRTGS